MKLNLLLTAFLSMGLFNLFGQEKTEYKFSDPEDKACIVCDHVMSKERPILYATHDSEGDWQFMCGQDDHTEENAKVISLKQATEIDQSLNNLFEMPLNVGAERESKGAPWKPFRLSD